MSSRRNSSHERCPHCGRTLGEPRPEFKGRGLARLCVAASMQALAAGGRREFDLFVTETNTPARALYERLGFRAASAA